MKKVLLFVASIGVASAAPLSLSAAQAAPVLRLTPAQYYYVEPIFECRAQDGRGAWGVAQASTVGQACHLAKRYCLDNSPYVTVCYAVQAYRIQ